MAVIKVIELIAQSEKSWEDAVQTAVAEASKTLRDIKAFGLWQMRPQQIGYQFKPIHDEFTHRPQARGKGGHPGFNRPCFQTRKVCPGKVC
jgi:flavin-binding protein dodecin